MSKEEKNQMPEPIFVPAKPDEKLPDDIWIPNRRERRKMKRSKNNGVRAMAQIFNGANEYAKMNPEFKKDIYKALYENLLKLAKEKEGDLKDDAGTTEGD